MRISRFAIAGAIGVSAVPLAALPAYADGPPSPPVQSGCTFDGSTGLSACTAVTQDVYFSAPLVTGGVADATTFTVDGPNGSVVTGVQICDALHGDAPWTAISGNGTLEFIHETITTTVHHGVSPNGEEVGQPTTVTQDTLGYVPNGNHVGLLCGQPA